MAGLLAFAPVPLTEPHHLVGGHLGQGALHVDELTRFGNRITFGDHSERGVHMGVLDEREAPSGEMKRTRTVGKDA